MKKPTDKSIKVVASNRQAYHDYFVQESYEAGIVLTGNEVKSVREGRVNLKDSYILVKDGEALLLNMHISKYGHSANVSKYDPTRTRKLLLHKSEILKLASRVQRDGFTLVPLKLYIKGRFVKLELAVARGKKLYDKRESERARQLEHEARAAIKNRLR
ncbi:MAG: SsrA-binding protein SmpB [Acidobacteriota bacterium]|nr:SsrA-binding protein SmpB [Blastocatellia bacterium]MDW8411970.1 SsrA-binding protein SmpB [Acidobacteriota bacterium]